MSNYDSLSQQLAELDRQRADIIKALEDATDYTTTFSGLVKTKRSTFEACGTNYRNAPDAIGETSYDVQVFQRRPSASRCMWYSIARLRSFEECEEYLQDLKVSIEDTLSQIAEKRAAKEARDAE